MKDYDTIRKLNAIVRFSILYSVIIYLYKRKRLIYLRYQLVVGLLSILCGLKQPIFKKMNFRII